MSIRPLSAVFDTILLPVAMADFIKTKRDQATLKNVMIAATLEKPKPTKEKV